MGVHDGVRVICADPGSVTAANALALAATAYATVSFACVNPRHRNKEIIMNMSKAIAAAAGGALWLSGALRAHDRPADLFRAEEPAVTTSGRAILLRAGPAAPSTADR